MCTDTRMKGLVVPLALVVVLGLPSISISDEPAAHDHTHADAASGGKPGVPDAYGAVEHMQAMHDKMMAAKTPAERQSLMAEHMKSMQEGMATMQQMGKSHGSGTVSSQRMQMRMDMMTMMMQMMMDRQQMGGMPMMGAPPDKSGK